MIILFCMFSEVSNDLAKFCTRLQQSLSWCKSFLAPSYHSYCSYQLFPKDFNWDKMLLCHRDCDFLKLKSPLWIRVHPEKRTRDQENCKSFSYFLGSQRTDIYKQFIKINIPMGFTKRKLWHITNLDMGNASPAWHIEYQGIFYQNT